MIWVCELPWSFNAGPLDSWQGDLTSDLGKQWANHLARSLLLCSCWAGTVHALFWWCAWFCDWTGDLGQIIWAIGQITAPITCDYGIFSRFARRFGQAVGKSLGKSLPLGCLPVAPCFLSWAGLQCLAQQSWEGGSKGTSSTTWTIKPS